MATDRPEVTRPTDLVSGAVEGVPGTHDEPQRAHDEPQERLSLGVASPRVSRQWLVLTLVCLLLSLPFALLTTVAGLFVGFFEYVAWLFLSLVVIAPLTLFFYLDAHTVSRAATAADVDVASRLYPPWVRGKPWRLITIPLAVFLQLPVLLAVVGYVLSTRRRTVGAIRSRASATSGRSTTPAEQAPAGSKGRASSGDASGGGGSGSSEGGSGSSEGGPKTSTPGVATGAAVSGPERDTATRSDPSGSDPSGSDPQPATAGGDATRTSERAQDVRRLDELIRTARRRTDDATEALDAGEYDDAASAFSAAVAAYDEAETVASESDVAEVRSLRADAESRLEAVERRQAEAAVAEAEATGSRALDEARAALSAGQTEEAAVGFENARAAFETGQRLAADHGVDADGVDAGLRAARRGRIDTVLTTLETRLDEGLAHLGAGLDAFSDSSSPTREASLAFDAVEHRLGALEASEGDDLTDEQAERVVALRSRLEDGTLRAAAARGLAAMRRAESLFADKKYFEAREVYRRVGTDVTDLADTDERGELASELRNVAEACEWNIEVTRQVIWGEEHVDELVTVDLLRDGWAPPAPKTTIEAVMRELDGYDLVGQLGGGGFADVFEVRRPDGVLGAVKIPRVHYNETVPESKLRQFVAEATNWQLVDDHPNVVDVIEYGEKPVPWLLLERCVSSLRERLDAGMAFEDRIAVLVAVGSALSHANGKGIVHLDVKPENVLFDPAGTPKLGDWGLSKVMVEGTITTPGLSNSYAAPEQLDRDLGPRNVRTDVYQYGVLAYELITGQNPFEVGSREDVVPPSDVADDVPGGVDEPLLKALSYDQRDRYEQVVQVRDALVSALGVEA